MTAAAKDTERADQYDEEYYLRGVASGRSCYTNYMWLPELTCSMAMSLIDHLPIRPSETCLDYGAARGYLVRALHVLHRFAWGTDVSEWAIRNCHPDVRKYMAVSDGVRIPWKQKFQWLLCKDTLEHISPEVLPDVMASWAEHCEKCFVVVPLGDGKRFVSGVEEMDTSHQIREPLKFWVDVIALEYEIVDATYSFPGVKSAYAHIPRAHGFIVGRREA